jgi:hypothetical protein
MIYNKLMIQPIYFLIILLVCLIIVHSFTLENIHIITQDVKIRSIPNK